MAKRKRVEAVTQYQLSVLNRLMDRRLLARLTANGLGLGIFRWSELNGLSVNITTIRCLENAGLIRCVDRTAIMPGTNMRFKNRREALITASGRRRLTAKGKRK